MLFMIVNIFFYCVNIFFYCSCILRLAKRSMSKSHLNKYSIFVPGLINEKHSYQKMFITSDLLAMHYTKDLIVSDAVLAVFAFLNNFLPFHVMLVYEYIFYSQSHFPEVFREQIEVNVAHIDQIKDQDIFSAQFLNQQSNKPNLNLCYSENVNNMFYLIMENNHISPTVFYYLILCSAYVTSVLFVFRSVENIVDLKRYHKYLCETLGRSTTVSFYSSHDRIKSEQFPLYKKICLESACYLHILSKSYFSLPEHYILHIEKTMFTNLDFLSHGSLSRDIKVNNSAQDITLREFVQKHSMSLRSIKYNSIFIIFTIGILLCMFIYRMFFAK